MGLWSGFDKTNVSLEHLGSRLKQVGSIWSGFDKTNVSLEHLGFRLKQVGSIWSGFDKTNVSLEHLGLLGPVLRFVILDTNIFIRS